MRSALYYPYTSVNDVNLVKTALLLWDHLEFIVPWEGFRPNYTAPGMERAMELIGVPRVPEENEKREVHNRIEELISEGVPPALHFDEEQHEHFQLFDQKLLPDTWRLLRRSRLAARASETSVNEASSLVIMSLLADSCAGSTKSRVTDRGDAYATLTSTLSKELKVPHNEVDLFTPSKKSAAHLVPIGMSILDVRSIDLRRLIEWREREARGHRSLRELRHRYTDSLESYVKRLITIKAVDADLHEVRRQFHEDMQSNLHELKDELGLVTRNALLSKEILVTALAGVGTLASVAFAAQFPMLGVLNSAGVAATVGGLVAAGNSLFAARKATWRKHPMSYLYKLR